MACHHAADLPCCQACIITADGTCTCRTAVTMKWLPPPPAGSCSTVPESSSKVIGAPAAASSLRWPQVPDVTGTLCLDGRWVVWDLPCMMHEKQEKVVSWLPWRSTAGAAQHRPTTVPCSGLNVLLASPPPSGFWRPHRHHSARHHPARVSHDISSFSISPPAP